MDRERDRQHSPIIMTSLPIVHNPSYDAGLPPGHRFPMEKYRRLASLLTDEGLAGPEGFHSSAPAEAEWLELAHERRYVDQVIAAQVPERIAREIGFPVDDRVALRARLSTSGTVLTARLALEHGIACNTAGGSHHARRAQGAGFCTFNDVAVAAHVLITERQAARVLVLDLDVHQGDGTAEICAGHPAIRTVSMHAARNYPARKQQSSIDVALADETGDGQYLETLERLLPAAMNGFNPDIVFYNAGVDPHRDDRLGRLALSDLGLLERDRMVFSYFRRAKIAVAAVIGGGYSHDIDTVARRHVLTFRAASESV